MISQLQGDVFPKSNPFDLASYFGVELARSLMFCNLRHRTEADRFGNYDNTIESYTNKLREQVEIIDSLSDSEVEELRKMSKLGSSNKVMTLFNNTLLELGNSFKTDFSQTVNNFSDEYLRLVYSEDVAEQMIAHFKNLRDLKDKVYELCTSRTVTYLSGYIDELDNLDAERKGEEPIEWVSSVRDSNIIKLIANSGLNVTRDDINYMISLCDK